MTFRYFGFALWLLLWPGLLQAGIAAVSLKDLHDNSWQQLAADKPQLLMFFGPDCRWCDKQMLQMQQLQQQCPQVRQALIGINGGRNQLRAVLRQHQISLNAYQGDKRFIRHLGGIAATPYTLVIDEQQHIIASLRGYIDPERLQAITQALSAQQCGL